MLANISWALTLTSGFYLMCYIRNYLRNKPPGFKTILDDLYIQLHEYWIVEGMIIYGAVTIYELQETSWILSWIWMLPLFPPCLIPPVSVPDFQNHSDLQPLYL